MQTMYPGQVNSPQTELASAISNSVTTIPLLDASKLPAAPNLAVIGSGEDAETILYTGKSGNNLTGVTRGFQGTARSWSAGAKVARNFTAYDHDTFRQNIEEHVSATTGVHGATSADTPNTIVQRDANGRFKAAAPSASNDVARKAEVDAALERASTAINAGYNEDPNTTNKAFILTNHENSPVGGSFWYIRTYFYESFTGNRSQIAIMYSGSNQVYTRYYHQGSIGWSPWVELTTANRPFFNEDIRLPNNKGLFIRDNVGTLQVVAAINASNVVQLGDPDLETNVRGSSVKINGNVAWHAGNLPVESGTFTPYIQAGTSGNTYDIQVGYYQRVGKLVYYSIYLSLSSKDGSMSGNVTIRGLPFVNNTGAMYREGVASINSLDNFDLESARPHVYAHIPAGQSYIFMMNIGDNTNTTPVSASQITNTTVISISGIYSLA